MRQYHNPNKGAVKLAQNYTEYAYNYSTSATTDTTSFAWGEEGVPFRNFAPSGTGYVEKRVRFKNPIKSDDVIILEINVANTKWIPIANNGANIGNFVSNEAGTVFFGVSASTTIATDPRDISICFYSKPYMSPSATWSDQNNNRWRVRKISSGNFAESPQINPSITVDGDYTVQHGIETVNVNASEASILLNSMIPSDRVTIRKLGSDATKYITITPPAGCTIEGLSEYRLYEQYASVTIERISETAFVTVGYDGGDLNVTGNLSVTGNSYFPELQWAGKIMGANQNLNTYLTGGIYRQRASANATLALNYPVAAAGVLQVMPNSTGATSAGLTQIYYQFSNPGAMWRRWGDGVGTWSPWYKMIDSSNISNYSAPYYTAILPYTSLTYTGGKYIYTLPTIAVGAYTKIFVKILNTYYLSIQVNLRFPSGTVHNAVNITMGQNTGGGKKFELTTPISGGQVLFETVGYTLLTGSTLYIVGEYVRTA